MWNKQEKVRGTCAHLQEGVQQVGQGHVHEDHVKGPRHLAGLRIHRARVLQLHVLAVTHGLL